MAGMRTVATHAHQKPQLEHRIKQVVNNDLKEICKAYGYQVSGTKPVLQKRCLESESLRQSEMYVNGERLD